MQENATSTITTTIITDSQQSPPVSRSYKDTVFRMLFRDKANLLSLYNAINGSHYTDLNLLEINTLENAIYLSFHNDVSFLICDRELNLYEHQSTPSPNMTLRDLFYLADLLHKSVKTKKLDLFSSTMIRIPEPHFLIFYNGSDPMPEDSVYKLSDLFLTHAGNSIGSHLIQDEISDPEIELKVRVLNINLGYNENIQKACKVLYQYAQFVSVTREYMSGNGNRTECVNEAIDFCLEHDILKEFLLRNREAAMLSMLYEYDEETHIQNEKNISWQKGREKGREEGREEGISNVALTMIQKGFDEQEICECTGISHETYESLKSIKV